MSPVELAWLTVGAAAALMIVAIITSTAVNEVRQRRRVDTEERLRPLLLAVLAEGGESAQASCLAEMLRQPRIACAMLARHAWLVRGVWLQRLRCLVATPAMIVVLRRLAHGASRVDSGLALQLLGLAGDLIDSPRLSRLAVESGAAADAAAIGVIRGWPASSADVIAALTRLERDRPDILSALLPQLDRTELAAWLAASGTEVANLALALFIAGRLDLEVPPGLVLAGCRHERVQVRRAACLAVRHATQHTCAPELRRLIEEDPEIRVRVAALRALGRLPEPANLPLLRRVLEGAPWLVQAQAVAVILAHGADGRRLLAGVQAGAWRSGAVRWVREQVADAPGNPS